MPLHPHPALVALREAATAVLDHAHGASDGGLWRRWFEKPDERHFLDEVRAFIATLDHLLDVPPQMLTQNDLTTVGALVDRVTQRVEASIEAAVKSGSGMVAALTPAVYVIRARYEEVYRRGATKGA